MKLLSAFIALLTLITLPALQAEEAKTLHSGSWTKKTAKISGTWKIVQTGDTRSIVLDEAFKTKKAPDLKLVLSPLTSDVAASKTALKGGKVISLLKSPKGAQTYALPAEVDLSQYKSLLIHCEKYTKLWGAGAL